MEIFKLSVAFLGIIGVIYFLIKKYDTKLVLLTAGVAMCVVAMKPMAAFDAFASRMTTGPLIQAICSVLGFAAVMKITECDKHLVFMLSHVLKRTGLFLVPIAVLLTFAINIALPSASGCAAAVGAIFIPLLIYSGVRPAMAAATVFAGTYGSMLNPGLSHNAFIAKLANVTPINVVATHQIATLVSIVVVAVVLGITALIFREAFGYQTQDEDFMIKQDFKVNYLYALINILPLAILILGFTNIVPALKMGVAQAMLIGIFIAVIATRTNPEKVSKGFFNGMGGAYADILGIIIGATVFVAGLKALGAVQYFIDTLISNPQFASLGATIGPFLLGIVTGSGDAAAFAFNEAVTPHSAQFGVSTVDLGSLAALSGCLGRSMSPLAGAGIICAGFAKVSSLDVAKRTAIAMILALLSSYFILGIGVSF